MNNKAALGLSAGALVIGLFAGLALGGDRDEPTKAAGAGPTNTVTGVPVGYARSKEGAVNAALGYEGALGALRRAAESERRPALRTMAAPDSREEILKTAQAAYGFLDQQFGDKGIVRGSVVGYRVTAYDQNAAQIELWEVSVVGSPDAIPVRSGWSSRTIRLRWIDGDWKLEALPTETAGPTPQANDAPSDPAQVLDTASRLEEVRFVGAALP